MENTTTPPEIEYQAEDLGSVVSPFAPQFDAPEALSRERGEDGLNGRERFVLEAVLEGQEPADAALNAGYEYPGQGSQVLSRPHVQNAMRAALCRVGLTEDRIAEKINEGLSAERAVVCDKSIEMVPDHSAQHKYLTTLLELRGDLSRRDVQEDTWETMLFAVRARRAARGAEERGT